MKIGFINQFIGDISIVILVGALDHLDNFSMYLEESSQLTFIFFRVVGIPPTSILSIWESKKIYEHEHVMITYGIVSMGDFAQCLLDSWLYGRRFHVRWVEEIRDMGYMVILCNFCTDDIWDTWLHISRVVDQPSKFLAFFFSQKPMWFFVGRILLEPSPSHP